MSDQVLAFDSVSFTYPGTPAAVLKDVSFNFGTGWTVLAGANGSGKTTLLRLACGLIVPDSGRVLSPGSTLYCPQRVDAPPEGFTEFVREWADGELLDRLGIEWDWPMRWDTLSMGERKRAQMAVAIASSPEVLAVDEPVNHLDLEARGMVRDALAGFRGIGLLVSHDRDLMDSLAVRCGLLFDGTLTVRRGGYTAAWREEHREQEARKAARAEAAARFRRLGRDARRKQLTARTLQARSSGRRISYREICRTGADGPSRIDSTVQKAGQLARTARARTERAKAEMESIRFRKTYRKDIGIPGESSGRNTLVELTEGVLLLGGMKLEHPRLAIAPGDRTALTGPNGSGKSTLFERIRKTAELPQGRLLSIGQELSAEESAGVLERARGLDRGTLGSVMTCVRRLGSDPEALLGSVFPSPGETRKLLLALGLLENPWLVMMDEPTNHLDLTGMECLEAALSELKCSLLLVSHDRRFLRSTTDREWTISVRGRRAVLSKLR